MESIYSLLVTLSGPDGSRRALESLRLEPAYRSRFVRPDGERKKMITPLRSLRARLSALSPATVRASLRLASQFRLAKRA